MKIEMGQHMADKYNGFSGRVTAICHYADGETRIRLESRNKATGEVVEYWTDENRLQATPSEEQ